MKCFFYNNDGATAIEYSLIAALIVLACVAGFSALGGGSNGMWGKINANVSSKL
jgi:pilus assembly protein Flp/PilA